MQPSSRIIFLHIPKTAGQSVHNFLEQIVGSEAIAPCRVNTHLWSMTVPELRHYRVFSGHLDWGLLDCIGGSPFVFTILRRPIDRILSFYFFIREDAKSLSKEELRLPQNSAKAAALNLHPDEYFTGGPPPVRAFLDNHYDNFYMYYFAGRTYNARGRIKNILSPEQIMQMALTNLALIHVYSVEQLDLVERDIRFVLEETNSGESLAELRVNQGSVKEGRRMAELKELGATTATWARLRDMTIHDDKIWDRFFGDRPISSDAAEAQSAPAPET